MGTRRHPDRGKDFLLQVRGQRQSISEGPGDLPPEGCPYTGSLQEEQPGGAHCGVILLAPYGRKGAIIGFLTYAKMAALEDTVTRIISYKDGSPLPEGFVLYE